MATRFYLPSAGSPALGSLAYGSGWNKTNQATRFALVTAKTDSADVARILTSTAPSPEYHCGAQYQSAALAAQTITGTLKGQMRANVNNVSFNGTIAITARVVSSDGTTIRGHLVGPTPAAPVQGTTPPELTTSSVNRSFKDSSGSAVITLSDVVCEDGDILVIEVGAKDEDTGTSRSANIRLQDLVAAADLPENETTTTALSPWVEFTHDFAFEGEEPLEDYTLVCDTGSFDVTGTDATLTYDDGEEEAPEVAVYARFQAAIMCN